MSAPVRIDRQAPPRYVASSVLQQIAIDAQAGHVVDIERVWPADPNVPAFHRFVCTCGRIGPEAKSRRRAVAGGNYHRRITRAKDG